MPTTTIRVYSVRSTHVGQRPPYLEKFQIMSCTEAGIPNGQYGTFDPFVASLCDQAAKQQFAVDVTWRDTTYGRDIIKGGARRSEEAA